MKILHISTNLNGGAGKATFRIHDLMRKSGIESKMLVRYGAPSEGSDVFAMSDSYSFLSKGLSVVKRKLHFKDKYCAYEVSDPAVDNFYEFYNSLDFEPDIIVLHWVSGFISHKHIEWLSNHSTAKKIFWFSMDMAPFTGGCHYSWGCEGYGSSCKQCPATTNILASKLVSNYFAEKAQIIQKCDIDLIVPNRFVESQAKLSALGFSDIHTCYLPIDSNVFSVNQTREFDKEIVILFGAANFKNKRKGLQEFIKAIDYLSEQVPFESMAEHVKVLIPGVSEEIRRLFKFDCEFIEYANSDEELSNIYSQAHIFVSTSLEDSGPMMVVEALMSGLPVLSFSTGIAKDVISEGDNGYCSPIGDSKSVAENLITYLNLTPQEKRDMSLCARNSVIEKMDVKKHSESFLKILNII
ncbi:MULTISPECIES: glycosyltransferase [Pseudoalteromonas]|nr:MULTISPECIES: glycosyltransferase [Pseudoalteromonas]MCG7547198.1 glycosyltransferase [Pseudoalteromonas sp. Of7M-16]